MHSLQRLGKRIASNPVRLTACLVGFVLLVPYGYIAGGILHFPKVTRPWFAIFVCATAVLLMNWLIPMFWGWVKGSIRVTAFFMHYAADRPVGVSHVEAMISAGNYEGAAMEIDVLLAQHGVEAGICQVGLDLHLGKFGSRERGEALLRRMRNENPAQYERMATQRLVDIYMERPETHGKALTELRRLATKFPGTPEAAGALRGIEQLKPLRLTESSMVQ